MMINRCVTTKIKFLGLLLFLISFKTLSASYTEDLDAVNSYSNCSAIDNGDQYIFKVSVNLKDITALQAKAPENTHYGEVFSIARFMTDGTARGLAFGDKTFKGSLSIDGRTLSLAASTGANRLGGSVFHCGDNYSHCDSTSVLTAHQINLVLTVNKTFVNNRGIALWVGVQPKDGKTPFRFSWENKGSVYISPFSTACTVIPPNFPTLPDEEVTFTMRVPDWDLGEITSGTQEIALTKPEEQMCLDFPGVVAGNSTDYFLKADSVNMTGTEFRLLNNADASTTISYRLKLNDGKGAMFDFPGNSQVIRFPTDGTSQVCYDPTFYIQNGSAKLIPGNYTDVIKFDVITKT